MVAGSLHGPVELPAPMDRTRAHNFAPLVKPVSIALDLLALFLNAQFVPVTGSTLVWIS
jgi:hypothetical protein